MSLKSILRSSAIGKKVILPVWRAIYNRKYLVTRCAIVFPFAKKKHYQKYSTDPSLTQRKDDLNTLQRDGVLVLPEFFNQEEVHRMIQEVEPYLEQLRNNTYTGPVECQRMDDYGVYRMLEIDTICSSVSIFFEHPDLTSLASAYVSPNVRSFIRTAELRPDPGRKSIADSLHIDDWRMRFKAFVYLTDVGPEQAPFTYFIGSHREAKWRRKVEARYFRDGHEGGYLKPKEAKIIPELYEEKVCTAPAGSVILADLRGVHRGTPLVQGRRVMLINYFDVRNPT